MATENSPRVCRVIPTHPSAVAPGAGLPAFYLSYYLLFPTLHVVRKVPLEYRPRSLPGHVSILPVSYPDFALGNRKGMARMFLAVAKMLFNFVFFMKSIPAMLKFRPTIVHTHTAIPLFHGIFGKYILKARWIMTIHGSDFLEVRRNRLLQKVVGRVDTLCYVSERMGDELRQLFPALAMLHTPSGVNLDLFTDHGLPRLPQVVMVGRLSWQKGYSFAIQAFARFLKAHPHWRLVILGEGDERKAMESQITGLGLDRQVNLLGNCSQETVADILQQSSIFLLTSITEGFPKVLLEASACGTPVVATDVGDCREVSNTAGITVPSQNIEAIAEALTRLADDPDFQRECAARGKKIVENYRWENVAGLVARIYESS